MLKLSAAILATALSATTVQAAESFTELRLGLGVVTGINEAEAKGDGGTVTIDLDSTGGGNFDLGVTFGNIGDNNIGAGGYVGIFYRNHTGEDDAKVETTATAFGVNLGADLLLASSRKFLVAIGPRVAIGGSNQSIDLPEYSDGSGAYFSIALQAAAYVAITEKARIGIEVGVINWASSATQAYDDGVDRGDLDITMSGSGGYGSIVLGVTL